MGTFDDIKIEKNASARPSCPSSAITFTLLEPPCCLTMPVKILSKGSNVNQLGNDYPLSSTANNDKKLSSTSVKVLSGI